MGPRDHGSTRASHRRRPITARLLQGQQAALVMNVLDFCTGQLFDWFISSDTAFALIERLAGEGDAR